jgi:hypothetical protein
MMSSVRIDPIKKGDTDKPFSYNLPKAVTNENSNLGNLPAP